MRIATSTYSLLLGLCLGLTAAIAGEDTVADIGNDLLSIEGESQITVTVPDARGATGAEVTVPVMIAGATELGCLQMALLYDERLLEVVAVDAGPLLPERAIVDYENTVPGRLGLGFLSGPNAGSTGLAHINGDGIAFNVRFKILGRPGQHCPLTPHRAQAWQVNDAKLAVRAGAGEFTITGDWFRWLYLICALAVILIVGVVLWMRRRKDLA